MPPRRHVESSSSSLRFVLPLILVLLLIGGGVAGTLWGTGYFDQKKPISREGQVAFPALARSVQAYNAVSRRDLINSETGQLNVIWIPEEQVNPKMIRDLTKILGRVVSRDKQAGYILSERDLLPAGTRPGVSAGIPPGKRSVTVNVKEVPGLELLRQGDVFDLLAVLPPRDEPTSNIEQAALLGGIKPPDTRSGELARQTGIKPLVVGGTMIAISQGKSQSTGGAQGLVAQPKGRNAKTQEVVATIAVDPVEVTPLAEAIGLELKLYCVARSGHPDDPPVSDQSISLEGMVPVLTLARPLEAYSQITQDDLADHVTGRLNLYYFPADKVNPQWITSFTDLNGRVLARGLARGSVIQERDLMPLGTRPGIIGAVPIGMEAIPVPAEAITGLDRLRPGDRFEIHSRLPSEFRPSATSPSAAGIFGGRLPKEDQKLQDELRTGMRVLTKTAVVLQDADEEKGRNFAIAVLHEDVARVIQALQADYEMFAVGQSDENKKKNEFSTVLIKQNYNRNRQSNFDKTMRNFVSFGEKQLTQTKSPTSKAISVPVLVADVPARTRMSVEHFIEPSTGRIRYLEFDADQVLNGVVTDLRKIIGYRAGRELYAGEWVLEGDLCEQPRWSVPCDIPADWSVIELSSTDIRGLEIAEVGDWIYLVAARPISSKDLQGKSEWPDKNSRAVFQKTDREDLFTQADIVTLSAEARVVGRVTRIVDMPTVEEKETVGRETQLGETTERQSVQTSRTRKFEQQKVLVWQVAMPLKAIPAVTEALTVQSIVPEDQNGDNNRRRRGGANERNAAGQNKTLDNEVAIFAVLRSPKTTTDQFIPNRDIVSGWMSRWGTRFSEFFKSERQQSKAVKTVQQIRGTQVIEKHWLNGRPYEEFPTEAIHSRTVETLIDRRQKKGK